MQAATHAATLCLSSQPIAPVVQGLKLDTDVAALMEAEAEAEGSAGDAALDAAPQQGQQAPPAATQRAAPAPQAANAGQQPAKEAEQQEDEEKVESMVDFLLRSRLAGTPPPAGSPAGTAGAAAGGLQVDPRLHTWHPVGQGGEVALGCVAERLRQLGEVRFLASGVLACLS